MVRIYVRTMYVYVCICVDMCMCYEGAMVGLRVREQYFTVLLEQDIAFHDTDPSGFILLFTHYYIVIIRKLRVKK